FVLSVRIAVLITRHRILLSAHAAEQSLALTISPCFRKVRSTLGENFAEYGLRMAAHGSIPVRRSLLDGIRTSKFGKSRILPQSRVQRVTSLLPAAIQSRRS